MTDQEFIKDTGLFIGQNIFEFSLTESFESITNLFQTIKEYREFTNPDDETWFDYVHQIFNIFGFNTIKIAPRLISLQEMGVNHVPKALVCIVGPKETLDQIVFGLDWESYLFYAAKFHQVEWVILTNGMRFKVLNFGDNADNQKFFKCELDEIIKYGKTDSFLTLYKVFSAISHYEEGKIIRKGVANNSNKKGGRVLQERRFQHKEFWTQFLSLSKNRTKLFANTSPGVNRYIDMGAGKTGIIYDYIITTNEGARIQLYIDNKDVNWNKSVFDSLIKNKKEIEGVIGQSLVWDRLDNNRASIIRFHVNDFGLKDKDKWPELHEQMIEAMIRFEKAFQPFIKQINY